MLMVETTYEIETHLHGGWRFAFIDGPSLEDLDIPRKDFALYGKTWRVVKLTMEEGVVTERAVLDKTKISAFFPTLDV